MAANCYEKILSMELCLESGCTVKAPLPHSIGLLIMVDIIREWQAKHLYDDYKLTSLHVFRSKMSKSFDHQVLATWVFALHKVI